MQASLHQLVGKISSSLILEEMLSLWKKQRKHPILFGFGNVCRVQLSRNVGIIRQIYPSALIFSGKRLKSHGVFPIYFFFFPAPHLPASILSNVSGKRSLSGWSSSRRSGHPTPPPWEKEEEEVCPLFWKREALGVSKKPFLKVSRRLFPWTPYRFLVVSDFVLQGERRRCNTKEKGDMKRTFNIFFFSWGQRDSPNSPQGRNRQWRRDVPFLLLLKKKNDVVQGRGKTQGRVTRLFKKNFCNEEKRDSPLFFFFFRHFLLSDKCVWIKRKSGDPFLSSLFTRQE